VAVVGFAGQDVAGHVSVLDALHADHDGAVIVVEAVRHRFAEEPDGLLHDVVALDLHHVVGVVETDPVAALAGAHPGHRGGEDKPGLVVLWPVLAYFDHGEAVTPQRLELR
jgi:hypothetical protein